MITEIKGSDRTLEANMNQFEAVENMDAYNELANAVVVLACNDYRNYKKNFHKNQDVLAYINQRLADVEENTEQHYNLQIVQEDTERDQRLLQSKIAEIEKFLHSQYGMTLSHGLGDVILEKIQNEYPTTEPSAERGYALFKKKEKKMQERIKKLFERGKR